MLLSHDFFWTVDGLENFNISGTISEQFCGVSLCVTILLIQFCNLITFTLIREPCPLLYLNDIRFPVVDIVKYLGLYIDKRLTWNPHT